MQTEFVLPLPGVAGSQHRDYPQSRTVTTALTVSERLPACLTGTRNKPALYRFLIHRGNRLEQFYVGETVHFATRMGQYCGMVRRLLLLASGAPSVVIEKHPFRHVQYHIASALLKKGHYVTLEWTYLPSVVSKRGREKLEQQEQQRLGRRQRRAVLIAGKRRGNFETHRPPSMLPIWALVHSRLTTCPARRGKPPPFVV